MIIPAFLLALCACAPPPPQLPPRASAAERDALTGAVMALGPSVAFEDAQLVAGMGYELPRDLAADYGKALMARADRRGVAFDFKTPALCRDWAETLERRLLQLRLRTLEVHVVISPKRALILVEHSAVVVTAPGQPLQNGLLLDPCRHEGALVWGPVRDDRLFDWRPRDEALLEMRWGRRPWYGQSVFDGRLVRPDPLAP